MLLFQRAGDERYERAALRWHARLCSEHPQISLAQAGVVLRAFEALGEDRALAGRQALTGVLEGVGARRCVEALGTGPG